MLGIRAAGMCVALVFSLTGSVLAQYGTQNSNSGMSSTPMGTTSSMPTTGKNNLLVDQNGMTVYTYDKDTPGTSNCTGKCATVWPPLLAPAGATASGKFSIITRKDGAKQWAYDGKPLYLYSKDTKLGEDSGNGFKGVWHVVTQTP
jgi:predicted lipoprotein with Yx(FWY)xxD motif